VITGFNTDIEHDGVVYHVQTEDKGLDTPLILSLVYVGGAILASKRAPYKDLIAKGFSDEALSERLKRQHKLICAAINSGRINDLKKMSARTEGLEPVPELVAQTVEASVPEPPVEVSSEPELVAQTVEAPFPEPLVEVSPELELVTQTVEASVPEPPVEASPELELVTQTVEASVPEPPVEVSSEFELEESAQDEMEEEAVSSDASEFVFELESQVWSPPEKVEPPPPTENTASPDDYEATYTDQDLEDYSAIHGEGLAIILLDDAEFYSGDSRTVRVLIVNRKGDNEKPLNSASVSIKILGTTFRPLIYSLKTDREGVATVATQIPSFTSGRAAVLIRAVAKDQAAELRRVIHPGS
jgi:hypothetical protein